MAAKHEYYPVPKAQKIISNLSGAKYFSTLDTKDPYVLAS